MNRLKSSYLYGIYTALTGWASRQWEGSLVAAWLTGQKEPEDGWFDRILRWFRQIFLKICEGLRLPRLLQGSIFLHPGVFGAAAMVLAPLCPTLVILALVGGSFFGLLLKLGTDRNCRLEKSPMGRYVALYAGIYCYAIITSTSFRGSLYPGLLTVAFVLFFFTVAGGELKGKHLRPVLWCMVGAGVLVSLYGFYQFLFPEKFRNVWTDVDMFSSIAFRVYSTLENPNVLGEYFLLIIPLCCGVGLTASKKKGKVAALGAAALMVVCLVLTYSRGCYLGLLFAAGVFLVLMNPRLLIPGIVVLLLSPLYLPESVISRFTSIGNMGDTSTSYRVYIWLGTLAMLKDYWFCGVGPGIDAFNMVYPEYAYNAVTAPHSHSLYLQLICDTGMCGLAVFLILLVSFYRMMFTAVKHTEDKKIRTLQISGIASITGFLVQGATDFTFYNYRVMLLFWAVLGLSVCFARMGRKEKQGEEVHD